MIWERVLHNGYYMAVSDITGNEYVVRTRPLNDGWMAIADGYVIGEGLSLLKAKQKCEACERADRKELTQW